MPPEPAGQELLADLGLTGQPPPAVPPLAPNAAQPPFHDIPPLWFERLCVDVATSLEGVQFRLFGRDGQRDDGIDMYATCDDGALLVWQAKRRREFSPGNLRRAIERIVTAPQGPRVRRFVVVGPFDDRDRHLLTALDAARLAHPQIDLDLIGRERLTAELRRLPEVVRCHLGEAWRDHLCGVPSGGEPSHDSDQRSLSPTPLTNVQVVLPDGHVGGRQEEAELIKALQDGAGRARPVVVEVVGPGGFGKTTLAEWALLTPEVRSLFPEGGLWLDVGPSATDADLLVEAYVAITRERPVSSAVSFLRDQLGRLLDGRAVLIVLDDVWDQSTAPMFRSLLSESSGLIVTTRNAGTGGSEAAIVTARKFDASLATRVLKGQSAGVSAQIVRPLVEVGAGWPVLLRLLTSALNTEVELLGVELAKAVEIVAERFTSLGPASLDLGRGEDRRRAIAASIELGLEQLGRKRPVPGIDDARAAYLALGIFPRGVEIPFNVVDRTWQAIGATSSTAASRALSADLTIRSLIERSHAREGAIRRHDVVHDYLRHAQPKAHEFAAAALLNAIRPQDGWGALPAENGFIWEHLGHLLRLSGLTEELIETLLDPRYLTGKISVAGPTVLRRELAIARTDPRVEFLFRALRQSVRCLRNAREKPAATLASRLRGVSDADTLVAALEAQVRGAYLRPRGIVPDLLDSRVSHALVLEDMDVSYAYWSPDGRYIAGLPPSSCGARVPVWEPESDDRPALVTDGEGLELGSIQWAPHGPLLAVSDYDLVRVYDVASPRDAPVSHPIPAINEIVWSPDGTYLICLGDGETSVVTAQSLGAPASPFRDYVESKCVRWAPDSSAFAIIPGDFANTWNVLVYHVNDGNLLSLPHDNRTKELTWSPDADALVTVDEFDVTRCWDTRVQCPSFVIVTEDVRQQIEEEAKGPEVVQPLAAVELPAEQEEQAQHRLDTIRALLSSNSANSAEQGLRIAIPVERGPVMVCDFNTPALETIDLPHPRGAWTVSWKPDGTALATVGRDKIIRIWNLAEPSMPGWPVPHSAPINSDFHQAESAERRAKWASEDYPLSQGHHRREIVIEQIAPPSPSDTITVMEHIRGVIWAPDGLKLATLTSESCFVWDVATTPHVSLGAIELQNDGRADWSSDSAALLVGGQQDGAVWRSSPHPGWTRLPDLARERDGAPAWSPTSQFFATATRTGITLWDHLDLSKPFSHLDFPKEDDGLSRLSYSSRPTWSADGSVLATVSRYARVTVWAPLNERCHHLEQVGYIDGMALTPSGNAVAVWGVDESTTAPSNNAGWMSITSFNEGIATQFEYENVSRITAADWLSAEEGLLVTTSEDGLVTVRAADGNREVCRLASIVPAENIAVADTRRFRIGGRLGGVDIDVIGIDRVLSPRLDDPIPSDGPKDSQMDHDLQHPT